MAQGPLRGVPPALANNEIFYTEDVRAASRLIAKTLGPLQLTVGADEVPGFAATMHGGVRLRNVSLLYLDLHVASAVDIPMLGPQYAVHMPMNGRAVVEHRGRSFSRPTPSARWSAARAPRCGMAFDHDSPQLIIRIEGTRWPRT